MNRLDRRHFEKVYRGLTRRPPKEPPSPYRGAEIVDEILGGMGREESDDHKRKVDVAKVAFGRRRNG